MNLNFHAKTFFYLLCQNCCKYLSVNLEICIFNFIIPIKKLRNIWFGIFWHNAASNSYVDTYRMISVNAGSGNEDLKSIMAHSGRKIRTDDKLAPGEPDLHMYLRLADHLMKKGLIDSAMQSITEAADFNPESPLVLMAAAKCHTMTGHWEGSLQAVEAVLQMEPKNTKAVLFKAEALFNLCQFEAALVFFHRGQVLLSKNSWNFVYNQTPFILTIFSKKNPILSN